MSIGIPHPALKNARALVVGVANEHSIAYGCAAAFRELGAELAITYLTVRARPTSNRTGASNTRGTRRDRMRVRIRVLRPWSHCPGRGSVTTVVPRTSG